MSDSDLVEFGDNSADCGFLCVVIEGCVLLLMALGTVFVFSAAADVTSDVEVREFYNFTTLKQLVFFPAAILVMYFVSRIDYRRFGLRFGANYRSISPYLLMVSVFLLVLVLVPSIGTSKNLSRRWLTFPMGVFSLSFQPSELAKWGLIIFLAAYLDKNFREDGLGFRKFAGALLAISLVVLLIVGEDFGSAVLIGAVGFLMLLAGGGKLWHLGLAAVPAGGVFAASVLSSATRINRIKAFFDPESAVASSYQAMQSLAAISSGGVGGKGLGRGVCKFGHIPEDTTDFIYAVICEELGFAGGVFVILVFAVFVGAGLMVALRSRDRFGALLAGGVTAAIGLQAAVNIGVVTVVLPTKGIALPFVSAGGSGLLLSAAAVGVLLNVARNCGISRLSEAEG